MTVEAGSESAARSVGPDLLAAATLFVGVVGNISVVGLVIDIFRPLVTLVVSVVLTVVILLLWLRASLASRVNPRALSHRSLLNPALISAVATGAVLRWKPSNFLQGGQDQGLYVNMAYTLRRWGELRFPDTARRSLSAAAQQIYDMTALSSYYTVNKVQSTSFIEFYPLHPALMAVTSATIGGTGKFALTLFALLGIWCGWHLAMEIDGRRTCAVIFVFLLALNPALVFFAKFPVSETTALTYTMIGFLFLVRGVKAAGTFDRVLNLLISVLAFNSLFYVRWQFLLYLPFVLVIIVGNFVFARHRNLSRVVALHGVVCILLFGLSFVFYKQKMPELYGPVMASIRDMLPSTRQLVTMTLLGSIFVLLALRFARASDFELIHQLFVRRSGVLFVFSIVVSAGSILYLYRGESMYPWGYVTPADADSWVVRFHVLFRLAQYVSPWFLVMVMVMAAFSQPRNQLTSCVYLFAALCWTGVLLRPFVPYLYYYGRYIVVDALPVVLLLGSIGVTSVLAGRWTKVGAGVLALTLIYSAWFSVVQVGKTEGEDVGFYFGIASVVQKADVLVVSSVSQQVIVPLRAYFELTVLGVPEQRDGAPTTADVLAQMSIEARRRGGNLYYLGAESSPVPASKSIGVYRFTDSFISNTDHFREGGVSNVSSWRRLALPMRWVSNYFNWELYKVGLDQ